MSCEEYRAIALNNVISNLDLNEWQKRKKHVNGAISRGQKPWEEEEKGLALRLKSEGFGYAEIAKRLNDSYHHSEVRNRNCVYEMFRRINGKKNSSERVKKSINAPAASRTRVTTLATSCTNHYTTGAEYGYT